MPDKVEKAVAYAANSNRLEDNELSIKEVEKIQEDIENEKSAESFVEEVIKLVKVPEGE